MKRIFSVQAATAGAVFVLFAISAYGAWRNWDKYINVLLTFAGVAFAAIQVYLQLHAVRTKIRWSTELIRFDWDDIQIGATDVFRNAARDKSFRPDVVLCLSEVPALITALGMREFHRKVLLLFCVWKDKDEKEDYSFLDTSHIATDVTFGRIFFPSCLRAMTGKKILVVDDRSRSGSTIAEIRSSLVNLGFPNKNIRILVLWSCKASKTEGRIGPDYVYYVTPDEELHVPWGKME